MRTDNRQLSCFFQTTHVFLLSMTSTDVETTDWSFESRPRLSEIVRDYTALWKSDSRPDTALYIRQLSERDRNEAFVPLLSIEVAMRRRAGETPKVEDYRTLFPDREETLLEIISGQADESTVSETRVTSGSIEPHDQRSFSAGMTFGDYKLLEELGRGGMGVVFKAESQSLNRLVALKLIRPDRLSGATAIERFKREAKATAKLQHPGIVQVFEFGFEQGDYFFAMALVKGTTLRKEIGGSPLRNHRAAEVARLIAEALGHAHHHGIIHRDLKPSNVLIDQQGTPVISDFGLSKVMDSDLEITRTGAVVGTPAYMSPEQAIGRANVNQVSDVYSIGATLYAMLTGRPPFVASGFAETCRQVIHDEPISPRTLNQAVDRDMETICLKCLQKAPEKRYLSAEELASDLERYLLGMPILARPAGLLERSAKWSRRHPVVATLTLMISIIVLAICVVAPAIAIDQREKNLTLQKQLRESVSQRLAAESQRAGTRQPLTSIALGVEAIETTYRHGEPIPAAAHQCLLDAVARVSARGALKSTFSGDDFVLSPDGRWLFTDSGEFFEDVHRFRLWDLTLEDPASRPVLIQSRKIDLDTPSVISDAPSSRMVHRGSSRAQFTPDSRWLITCDTNTIGLWRLEENPTEVAQLVEPGNQSLPKAVHLSADSRWIVTCHDSGSVHLWSLERPKDSPIKLPAKGKVTELQTSPDGHWLLTGGKTVSPRVWNLRDAEPAKSEIHLGDGDPPSLSNFEFSLDGKWLASTNWETT